MHIHNCNSYLGGDSGCFELNIGLLPMYRPESQKFIIIFANPQACSGLIVSFNGWNNKWISTRTSHVVPHRSTTRALGSLTSQIGRDVVLSAWYGRFQEFLSKLYIDGNAKVRTTLGKALPGTGVPWWRLSGFVSLGSTKICQKRHYLVLQNYAS